MAKDIHVEIAEIQTETEQLESFLLMLEQSLIYNNFGGGEFLPAVTHMTDLATKITNRMTDLAQATAPKDDEVVQA